jgi:ParB/RepB/Spo0J family partition protein
MTEETYSLLPVEDCAIHPLAKIRFDYPVDELVESIAMVGQVQPGKAQRVEGTGSKPRYLVYIGCRRLIACQKAGVRHFKALVVTDVDDGRIQRELLTENMKRANLSVLESWIARHLEESREK